MSNDNKVLQQVLHSYEKMLDWSDWEMGDGDSARDEAERMIPIVKSAMTATSEANDECITAFEDYFQGDWNDPYFKEQRLNWEAAWDAAMNYQKIVKPLFTEMIAKHPGLSEELLKEHQSKAVPNFKEWTSDYVRDNLYKLKPQIEQAHGITGENK